jgi:hypothetical protein
MGGVQVIQDARLFFGNGIAGCIGTEMLAMAGEEDGWISIENAFDSHVQHTRSVQ